ncbi:MAG TPA: hypothetical protein VFV63_08245 [Ilumatobacteraceae bacterium]|nr:hypothetical protein [Ilumatobacteraceae bacterium]
MIAIDAVDALAIDVSKWPGINVAFLASLTASTLLTLAAIPYGKRRPIGTPVSWGEAMLGGTYAFGVLFLAFGVVPHQWIDHADKNLGWDRTRIVMGPGGILKPQSPYGGWNPITLQYEAVRDIVVVLIHVYFFGLLIFIWLWWQKRGQATSTAIETSTYGRPLVKKA